MDKIMCAAIWYKEMPTAKILPHNIDHGVVVAGHRHPHCIHTFIALTGKRSVIPECGKYVQGFLTLDNNFVDRKEAFILATKHNQINNPNKGTSKELYSEDIY